MVKFKNKTWNLGITRNASFFHASMHIKSIATGKKLFGTSHYEMVTVVKNGNRMSHFFEPEGIAKYKKSIEDICLSPIRLDKLAQAYKRLEKNLEISGNKLKQDATLSNFNKFTKDYSNLSGGLNLTAFLGRHMFELLQVLLKQAYPDHSEQSVQKLIAIITYPSSHTPLAGSQYSLLAIGAALQKKHLCVADIYNNNKILPEFKKHMALYSVIPVNYNEDPWTEQDIIAQLRNLMHGNCAKELRQFKKEHFKKVTAAKRTLKKLKNKTAVQAAKSLQLGTFLNESRKFAFCRASLAYRPLFHKVAKIYKLSGWQECWKLTDGEVAKLYFRKDLKILKLLKSRELVGIINYCDHTGFGWLEKKALNKFNADIASSGNSGTVKASGQTIHGMIASPGLVKGTARIILSREDFSKFKTGDIIVTAMTSVDFVPIMKRASAFVTNEGGITSHASIVARELNKPCIIGTKIATQVLKDGDIIEVDANKGIITKLNK